MANIFRFIGKLTVAYAGIKIIERIVKGKEKPCRCPDPDKTVDYNNAPFIPDQLIVWRKPGVSDADFNRWKNDRLNQYPGFVVKKLCAYCDDSLELWEGDNTSTLISERVAGASSGGAQPPPQGGGDAIACFSYNLILDLPEPTACTPPPEKYRQIAPRRGTGTPLTVAVFDTGLLPDLKQAYTENVTTACMPGGDAGWNFAYKNSITDDDYPSAHGSAVTGFIMAQEAEYEYRKKINILPVKIHNNCGKSDLFSILCGFAYAANCGAKIINASFGFYSAKGTRDAPAILAQFVERLLTEKKILLIAAAGNVNANESIGRHTAEDIRNLDWHPFFPACLSKNFENVLAVTTVSDGDGKVSPSQNYSNTVVDIGVYCDEIVEKDYRFADPLGRNVFIIGSSYATPIVTGKIAQHYDDLTSGMTGENQTINKSVLLNRMRDLNLIKYDGRFIGWIKDGNCTNKKKLP